MTLTWPRLKRAVETTWNNKLDMLTIKGIGKYRRVHASEIFSDDDCGMIHETQKWPQLRLYQDGESTPVSDLMARENHIFTVVPKVEVESQLDWRLAVFEAGEIYRRLRRSGIVAFGALEKNKRGNKGNVIRGGFGSAFRRRDQRPCSCS